MRMRKFLTEYKQGADSYSLHIYATSLYGAKSIAKLRNIGEVVLGETQDETGVSNKIATIEEMLHEACFIGFLALKSGKATPDDILGDNGLVHEIAHLLHLSPETKSAQALRQQLAHLKSVIPGYQPV